MRTIAVIGSNSFSGSDFIDLLLADPQNNVIGISRSPEKKPLFLPHKRHINAHFHFYQMDLNKDMGDMLKLFDSFRWLAEWCFMVAKKAGLKLVINRKKK